MIETIEKYVGDEFETPESVFKIAKKSDEQLLEDIINILEFYVEFYNSNS